MIYAADQESLVVDSALDMPPLSDSEDDRDDSDSEAEDSDSDDEDSDSDDENPFAKLRQCMCTDMVDYLHH